MWTYRERHLFHSAGLRGREQHAPQDGGDPQELTKDGWIKEIELEVWLNAGIYIPTDTRSETVKGMLDKALMAMQSIQKYVKEDRYAYYSEWMLQQHYNNSQILEWASSAIEKKEFKLYISRSLI